MKAITPANFFHDDNYCSELSDLLNEHLDIHDIQDAQALPDDWSITVMLSELEGVVTLSADQLADLIMDSCQDRWPEDPDSIVDKLKNAVSQSVDMKKLNELMPSLWYAKDDEATITKQDIIDHFTTPVDVTNQPEGNTP